MKKLIPSTAMLLALILSTGCNQKSNPILDLVLLQDITDEGIQHTTYSEIREILDFNRFLYPEHKIRTRILSDIQIGGLTENVLPRADANHVTDQMRKAQVNQFLKQVEKSIAVGSEGKSERVFSYIYHGVATELNRLSFSKATDRIAIINSDLLENSAFFSVYRASQQRLLLNHPDSVIKLFEGHLPLQNLAGIEVYIVYNSNINTDYLFREMSKLYSQYLESKGAHVTIVSNLISLRLSS